MPRVTEETVEHVARLARLSLSEEERRVFTRQLEEILDYAESIQNLDTTGIDPMSHAGLPGVLRDDTPHDGLDQESVLAVAPDASEGLFRVPRIIQ
ncbi:MAG: Asp-tRNA(Asn)/Glu-tRNA(Gln) amidotransferase subunit GatC [Vicinamibacteria bacterium]|nr:Asp-tRNA(Asn)/Glu-tRNA(Gln) amidotransferase subunit GatC [Vicinamibacteria bacterium]